ncbi:hypothetical protein [Streptosporangium carneum]|uniref:Uncharacterized protein n=1 Tax=Streptosporangium carneum TaxID=47481 RepID=A0A9W6IAU2_9ACTN|nr:hypothetical protein [Streptosporangium carneum]GLK14318.1 hypothetical protein GCM10017600_77300 [Streptosporangium carneum]
MSVDLATLVGEVSPYVTAAIGTYGAAVLAQAQEDAADATVGWGRKILQRVFGITSADEEAPETVAELAGDPENADLQAALRVRIRRILAGDPELAAEVAQMVERARGQAAVGQGQVIAYATGNAQQANLAQGSMNVSFGARHDR